MDITLSEGTHATGTVLLPASKSISNRVLIIRALTHDEFCINNLSACDDTQWLSQALSFEGQTLQAGLAGTTLRFLTALCSITPGSWYLTGQERLLERPIKPLIDALLTIGANIQYSAQEGVPPLHIIGTNLKGGTLSIDASVSSQFISALMLIAPYCTEGLELHLNGKISSNAYILLTAEIMKQFGIELCHESHHISIAPQKYRPRPYTIEADWSSASYFYSYLALSRGGQIYLPQLTQHSPQPDAVVASLFKPFGISTTYTPNGVTLSYNSTTLPQKLELDCSDFPDLVQTLAVTACHAEVPFCFTGIKNLALKETNRIEALCRELSKCGYLLLTPTPDTLCWEGKKITSNTALSIDTYQDHRMAMAFAPLVALRHLTICQAEVVSKSYPLFWQNLHPFCKMLIEK